MIKMIAECLLGSKPFTQAFEGGDREKIVPCLMCCMYVSVTEFPVSL